ncbi:MAG: excinuclease ABC subunit UvrC [Thermodesulfobacteriota bacterium]
MTPNEKLSHTPSGPGVYLFKDAAGRVIYVGKAANLKKRLSSYFVDRSRLTPKTGVLVERMASFDTVVTATEKEALILESTLIKRHKPRYNVILKDDKRYPVLRLDVAGQTYPVLEIVRKIVNDGALYFGPYTSSRSVRETVRMIDRTFRLRQCRDIRFRKRERPCLNYQMGVCLAPCCRNVAEDEYRGIVQEVVLFLKGRRADLVAKIRGEMLQAARCQDFEQAARLRDKMFAVEKTLEKQVAVTTDFADRDVIGFAENERFSVFALLHVRGGFLVGTGSFVFDRPMTPEPETVSSFVLQYYEKNSVVPEEILTAVSPADPDLVAASLSEFRGKKVELIYPKRGEKKRLVEMAAENAGKELTDRMAQLESGRQVLERLQKKLHLSDLPEVIECFDNSHLAGTETVAAMAVFTAGRPDRNKYRRYRLRSAGSGDDYASMAEVLIRRFTPDAEITEWPDLVLVDGGRGQLSIALSVFESLGLAGRFAVAAIAKKKKEKGETEDKIYLPGRVNPVNFKTDDPALFLLQQIRDEAHRFAISYQKARRGAVAFRSALDGVTGLGPKKKKALLDHFGTIEKIRGADMNELVAVSGISGKIAAEIRQALQTQSDRQIPGK